MNFRWQRLVIFAVSILFLSSCVQSVNKTTQGTVAGGAMGAGLGAIIGNQTGHSGAGVAIGSAIGALSGAIIGNQLDAADDQNEANRQRAGANQQLLEENRRLIQELKRRGADVYGTERGVVVNLPDVLFDFDRARLTRSAQKTVRDIGKVLAGTNRIISVEGHTDSIGTVTYNKKLSLNRSETVAQALEFSGVQGVKMRVRGFGEGRPLATNNSADGRARNRRVEVVVENY